MGGAAEKHDDLCVGSMGGYKILWLADGEVARKRIEARLCAWNDLETATSFAFLPSVGVTDVHGGCSNGERKGGGICGCLGSVQSYIKVVDGSWNVEGEIVFCFVLFFVGYFLFSLLFSLI